MIRPPIRVQAAAAEDDELTELEDEEVSDEEDQRVAAEETDRVWAALYTVGCGPQHSVNAQLRIYGPH